MEQNDAAGIIDVIADSLEAEPNQFSCEIHIEVGNMVGFQSDGGAPSGSPMIAAQQVNAPTDSVIGFNASPTVGGDVDIQQGNKAFSDNVAGAIKDLRTIAEELRNPKPSQSRLHRIRSALEEKVVPGVITAVLVQTLNATGFPSQNS